MEIRKRMIEAIEVYLAQTGMSEDAFGRRAVSDHKFVPRLRSGVGVTLTSIEKAEAYMADNRANEAAA